MARRAIPAVWSQKQLFINCTYLADDAEFDTSENIADNKKEFYEISLIENYRPFIFLDDAEKRTEYYSESDRNKLSGFLFRINLNDKYFWVYQHIYSVSRIDRSKNVIALFVGDTYDEIDSDIVQIDSRADRWVIEEKKDSMSQVLSDIKPHMTKKFMTAHCINEQDIQSISPIFLPRYKNV